MKLMTIVQEASRTGEYPRLSRAAAEQVLRAIAEWLEDEHRVPTPSASPVSSRLDVARAIRDEIIYGRSPR